MLKNVVFRLETNFFTYLFSIQQHFYHYLLISAEKKKYFTLAHLLSVLLVTLTKLPKGRRVTPCSFYSQHSERSDLLSIVNLLNRGIQDSGPMEDLSLSPSSSETTSGGLERSSPPPLSTIAPHTDPTVGLLPPSYGSLGAGHDEGRCRGCGQADGLP